MIQGLWPAGRDKSSLRRGNAFGRVSSAVTMKASRWWWMKTMQWGRRERAIRVPWGPACCTSDDTLTKRLITENGSEIPSGKEDTEPRNRDA